MYKTDRPKNLIRPQYKLQLGNHILELGRQTRIMGIINATPDSFSRDGCLSRSKKKTLSLIERKARQMVHDGADLLDIGGESTRPGARQISEKEEIARVIPAVERITKKHKIPVSIDTYKPTVAKHALDAGAVIVNNIMGTRPDKELLRMVKNYNAGIVLMHIKGTPRTMQKKIHYKNLICDIINSLKASVEKCLEIGINSDRIIVDPGIGFGKTAEHNLRIINRLDDLNILKKPLLIGTSRKSFIGKVLDQEVEGRLVGTIASICAGILRGAHIIRVHDIKACRQAALLTDAILNESYKGVKIRP